MFSQEAFETEESIEFETFKKDISNLHQTFFVSFEHCGSLAEVEQHRVQLEERYRLMLEQDKFFFAQNYAASPEESLTQRLPELTRICNEKWIEILEKATSAIDAHAKKCCTAISACYESFNQDSDGESIWQRQNRCLGELEAQTIYVQTQLALGAFLPQDSNKLNQLFDKEITNTRAKIKDDAKDAMRNLAIKILDKSDFHAHIDRFQNKLDKNHPKYAQAKPVVEKLLRKIREAREAFIESDESNMQRRLEAFKSTCLAALDRKNPDNGLDILAQHRDWWRGTVRLIGYFLNLFIIPAFITIPCGFFAKPDSICTAEKLKVTVSALGI